MGKGKEITYSERIRIETMLKDGKSIAEIAARLGRHYNTIFYERKKGLTTLRDGRTWNDYIAYSADIAQAYHDYQCTNKGRPLKIGSDIEYARYLERKVKKDRYSPYAALESAKGLFKTEICASTFYSYIDKKVFYDLKNKDLPRRRSAREKPSQPRRPSFKNLNAKSIEERPKDVKCRDSVGHWELDTVVGGKEKSKECLMVLTERMTRFEIIIKLPSKTRADVVKAFNGLEKSLGPERFRATFRTITADNGTEFLDSDGIEKSCLTDGGRTALYFCHANAPFERGSNENMNRLIRRWCPKGCDFAEYTAARIQEIQTWLNRYPRKLFGGDTPENVWKRNTSLPLPSAAS